MPYIKQRDRKLFDDTLEELIGRLSACPEPGNVNYVISRILLGLCEESTPVYNSREANYSKYNELIGVLECAKLELYRRQITPYEDKKILENGDV